MGVESAAARLEAIAPTRAAAIDRANPRRVSRALELAELLGDAPLPTPVPYRGRIAWIGLQLDEGTHAGWIANRAREQFDAGLVEEARALRARWDPSLPAFSAIGYAESWALLDGEIDRETAIARDAQRNVAFAKRQRTWFRREPDIEWVDATDPDGTRRATLAAARALMAAAR